jgi:hypothetical protein
MDCTHIEERVIIARLPETDGFGWRVSVVRATGRAKGKEHCLALLCGGNVGRALALTCARQIAETMKIDHIEIDPDLATTED